MTTITLEVPDELVAKLERVREQLPALLHEIVTSGSRQRALQTMPSAGSHQVYEEMIGFLAAGPTPQQIIAHQASKPAQRRLRKLLEKNREGGLTEAETAEMDGFEQVEDLMGLLKARARCIGKE